MDSVDLGGFMDSGGVGGKGPIFRLNLDCREKFIRPRRGRKQLTSGLGTYPLHVDELFIRGGGIVYGFYGANLYGQMYVGAISDTGEVLALTEIYGATDEELPRRSGSACAAAFKDGTQGFVYYTKFGWWRWSIGWEDALPIDLSRDSVLLSTSSYAYLDGCSFTSSTKHGSRYVLWGSEGNTPVDQAAASNTTIKALLGTGNLTINFRRNIVVFSDPLDPAGFPVANFLAVPDGDEIVSALSFKERLLLFCRKGIWEVRGDPGGADFAIKSVHKGLRCVGDGVPFGESVYFPTSTGFFRLSTEYDSWKIEPVGSTLVFGESLSPASSKIAERCNVNKLKWSGVHITGWFDSVSEAAVFSIPVRSSVTVGSLSRVGYHFQRNGDSYLTERTGDSFAFCGVGGVVCYGKEISEVIGWGGGTSDSGTRTEGLYGYNTLFIGPPIRTPEAMALNRIQLEFIDGEIGAGQVFAISESPGDGDNATHAPTYWISTDNTVWGAFDWGTVNFHSDVPYWNYFDWGAVNWRAPRLMTCRPSAKGTPGRVHMVGFQNLPETVSSLTITGMMVDFHNRKGANRG